MTGDRPSLTCTLTMRRAMNTKAVAPATIRFVSDGSTRWSAKFQGMMAAILVAVPTVMIEFFTTVHRKNLMLTIPYLIRKGRASGCWREVRVQGTRKRPIISE